VREYFRFENLRKEWTRQNYLLLLRCLIASLIVVVVTEILARRSIDHTLTFLVTKFPVFAYNALLVFLTMCFALLFRRRFFALAVAGGTWIGVAIADSILLSYRSMPLTAPDIFLMSSVRSIFDKYMSYFELGILMFLIAVAIACIFYILYCSKKYQVIFVFAASHFLLTLGLFVLSTVVFQSLGILQGTRDFHNLPRAYEENGFCYCFAASLWTGGVEEPDEYSDEVVDDIQEDIFIELPETAQDTPNIVFVQLESFFDPNYMKDLIFSENPVPNFQSIRENYPSGLLSVPCIGAGTANTEFEVLTGMNLSHFGVGEYPYMTIVDSACPETIAYCLNSIGYRTHAIHNNNATFYDRDIVYDNLSFQTFTSLEYMDLDPETDFTPTQWAKDAVLTEEILKCLNEDEEKDFVFTVSVQPHGRYPTEYSEQLQYLDCVGMDNPARELGFEYYLYQLRETDAFVGELVNALSDFEEKTVVVFYGDHLPSFNISADELSYGNEQTTEYVIWANYDIGNQKRDVQTYQLSAYVMNLCGIHEGVIFRLHQSYDFPDDMQLAFQDYLNQLEYDMLEGEHFALNGEIIQPIGLRFDVEDIVFESISEEDEALRIYGENFTRYSVVYLNGEACLTEFISEQELKVHQISLEDQNEIFVAQISAIDEMEILSQTQSIIWEEPDDGESETVE